MSRPIGGSLAVPGPSKKRLQAMAEVKQRSGKGRAETLKHQESGAGIHIGVGGLYQAHGQAKNKNNREQSMYQPEYQLVTSFVPMGNGSSHKNSSLAKSGSGQTHRAYATAFCGTLKCIYLGLLYFGMHLAMVRYAHLFWLS
jgi:hypothetical protein